MTSPATSGRLQKCIKRVRPALRRIIRSRFGARSLVMTQWIWLDVCRDCKVERRFAYPHQLVGFWFKICTWIALWHASEKVDFDCLTSKFGKMSKLAFVGGRAVYEISRLSLNWWWQFQREHNIRDQLWVLQPISTSNPMWKLCAIPAWAKWLLISSASTGVLSAIMNIDRERWRRDQGVLVLLILWWWHFQLSF